MIKFLPVLSLLLLSTACIKTADQVNREKRFDSMAENLKDSQGLLSDVVSQMRDMQSQLDRMNGRIEELEHRQKQLDPGQVNKMNESLGLLQTQQQNDSQQLNQIQSELKEQRTFLEKVTASLANLGNDKPKASAKKKSNKEELNDALELVRKNRYPEARKDLEDLMSASDLSAGDMNRLFHGLGRVEFYTKNYEKALVYFSKIYTKYPKSSLAPSSLLFIGRSLKKLGKNAEAKEAFVRVTEDYPNSSEANEAKKEV